MKEIMTIAEMMMPMLVMMTGMELVRLIINYVNTKQQLAWGVVLYPIVLADYQSACSFSFPSNDLSGRSRYDNSPRNQK